MRYCALISILLAVCLLRSNLVRAGDDGDLAKIEGSWDIIAITDHGKKVPDFAHKGCKLVLDKDKMTSFLPDGKKDDESKFILDPKKTPKQIDSTFVGGRRDGVTTLGIYELEGDSLRICVSRPGERDRPTGFDAEQHSEWELILLKRVKKE